MTSELNKLSLNNEIVLMRHDVRKARVHLVHKITRSIKTLRSGKGSKQPPEKDLLKADKLVEEIKTLKALQDDFITKTLLVYTEDPDKVLSDVRKTLQERVLAKMFTNKILETSISKFRKKYPNWAEDVPALLKNMKKTSKSKKKKASKSESDGPIKEVKPGDARRKKISESCVNSISAKDTINTNSGSWLISESPKDITLQNGKIDKNKIVSKNIVENGISKPTLHFLENNLSKSNKRPRKHEDNETSVEVASTKKRYRIEPTVEDDEIDQHTVENLAKTKEIDRKSEKKEEMKVVDPFFMTNDDSEYLTVVSSKEQAEALQNPSAKNWSLNRDEDEEYHFDSGSTQGYKQRSNHNRKSSFFNVNDRKSGGVLGKRNDNSSFKNSEFGSSSNHLPRRERRKLMLAGDTIEGSSKVDEEKLHPSWEAKRRQSCPAIPQFSGKKIVFDN